MTVDDSETKKSPDQEEEGTFRRTKKEKQAKEDLEGVLPTAPTQGHLNNKLHSFLYMKIKKMLYEF